MIPSPAEETMNRSGTIRMSPTPFRGVVTLDQQQDTPASSSRSRTQRWPAGAPFSVQDGNNGNGNNGNGNNSNSNSNGSIHTHTRIQDSSSTLMAGTSAVPTTSTSTNTNTNPSAASPSIHLNSHARVQMHVHELSTNTAPQHVRSRKRDHKTKKPSKRHSHHQNNDQNHRRSSRRRRTHSEDTSGGGAPSKSASSNTAVSAWWCLRCFPSLARSTWSCMNVVARLLFWCSALASGAAVLWYSYELKKHGTDPHLIAWFSAGAFVILGFPISMYGIVMHLANYHQPNVQMYVVRILWMVPIYSIESWLCLRYKDYAIYIETLRDLYESYVLYSFLQFLIQVLGGEETLILMLKDKSPTRGVHMWGLQWCVKPWLMGQPLRKTYEPMPPMLPLTTNTTTVVSAASGTITTAVTPSPALPTQTPRPLKRVHWTSPFFVKCKFGVLQYVLLKFVLSIFVMVLERQGWYKEGSFAYNGGYLYICILTNLSQCWALYCLIFFYYATKNELASIRPVGKFLSVKALVFFTWWQSVMISILYQMDLIPHYHAGSGLIFGSSGGGSNTELSDSADLVGAAAASMLPLTVNEALQLDEFGGSALQDLGFSFSNYGDPPRPPQEWSAEDVAKGLQDYLICIEMFVAALVHILVFPHTEYDPQAVKARTRALNQQAPHRDWNKRLGRKWKEWDSKSGWSGTSRSSGDDVHLLFLQSHHQQHQYQQHHHQQNFGYGNVAHSASASGSYDEDDDLRIHPLDRLSLQAPPPPPPPPPTHPIGAYDQETRERRPLLASSDDDDNEDENVEDGSESMYSMGSSSLHDDDDSYQEGDDDDDLENPRAAMASAFGTAHRNGNRNSINNSSSSSSSSSSNANNSSTNKNASHPGFVKALLDSAIPQDLRDNTVGIIKGEYVVERKTLLHHAATSDSYDLFSRVGRGGRTRARPQSSCVVSQPSTTTGATTTATTTVAAAASQEPPPA